MTGGDGACRRPTVPPVAWMALAAWVGAVAGEALWWLSLERAGLMWWIAIAGVSCAAILLRAVWVTRWLSVCALVVIGLTMGVTTSWVQGARVDAVSALVADCGAREWTGRVSADPREGSYGSYVSVRLGEGVLNGTTVSVRWPEEAPEPEVGQEVTFRAVLTPAISDEEFGRSNVRSGVLASGSAWVATVNGWPDTLAGVFLRFRWQAGRSLSELEGNGPALLRGIALGDRRSLGGSAVEQDFRTLGLSHVLAVSGMHLGLVCALAVALSRLVRAPRRVGLLVSVCGGVAFVVMTGMPTSAVRALLMVCVGALAETIGVRRDGLASLAAAVLVLVACAPWGVFSLGLQLSVLAVGGLLLFGRLSGAWAAACCKSGGLRRSVELMALTCVAQGVTMPVTTPAFGMFSVLAPVANAVVLPCLPVALSVGLGGLILAGTPLSSIGDVTVSVACWLLGALSTVVGWLASLPGAAVMVGSSGAAVAVVVVATSVALWVRWPLPTRPRVARRAAAALVAMLAVTAVGVPAHRRAEMVVCDVGQADAILVRDGGRTLLVDAGADAKSLRDALGRQGIRRIDAVVLTHAHDDHTAGLEGLVGVAQVGWVGVPTVIDEGAEEALARTVARLTPRGHVEMRRLAAGDTLRLGDTWVEVLWPDRGEPPPDNTNDTSVVLSVRRGTFDAVLTGDAEAAVQEALAQSGRLKGVEVLKVPHHGSENGLSEPGAAGWRPKVGIISVGDGNSFGHPHAQTLRLLEALGVPVYRTDQCGDITVEIGEDGFEVRTQRVCENIAHASDETRAPP